MSSAALRGAVTVVVVGVVVGVLVGGCDDAAHHTGSAGRPTGSASTPGTVPTPQSTTPAQATATPSTGARKQPSYSDTNPAPRRAGNFIVKVLLVTRLVRDGNGRVVHPDRPGLEFWGEKERTCVRRSSDRSETVGWGDWRAEGTDGRVYPADPSGVDPLPSPVYPFHKELAPGQCVTGWWLIPVPKLPGGPTSIEFAPGGGPTLIELLTLR